MSTPANPEFSGRKAKPQSKYDEPKRSKPETPRFQLYPPTTTTTLDETNAAVLMETRTHLHKM